MAGRQAGPGYVNGTKIKESKAVFKPWGVESQV